MDSITRRDFIKGAAGSLAVAGPLASLGAVVAGEGPKRWPPNVILVIDDQHNPRAMGWTGQSQVKTPHLDKLADQSVRFTNGYCNSPVCGPARHSMLTGLYTPQHGMLMNEKPMREGMKTIVSMLNEAGYTTANIGKMHNCPYSDRGEFQYVLNHEFFTSEAGITHYGPWLKQELARRGLQSKGKNWSRPAKGLDSWLEDPQCIAHVNWMSEDLTPEHWITDQSLAFIADQKSNRPDKPFFLHASYFPPHHPYGPIKKYADMYDPADIKLPPSYTAKAMKRWCTGRRKPAGLADNEVRRWIALYYGFVTQLDAQIGRLMAGLERLGQADNTIVIFTSDHGDMLAEHGRFYKGLMTEGSAGVPFMIRWPGVSKERAENSLVSHIDLAPTILAAAGIKPTRELPGKDLRPLLANEGKWDGDRAVFSVIHHRMPFSNMMWRKGDYKLIAAPGGGRRGPDINYNLYNIARDPYEMTDLADQADSAKVLAEMRSEMLAYWRPLEQLLPHKMPPNKGGPGVRTTWPTDPWKPARIIRR